MTSAVRCLYCLGRSRSGVIRCKDCQPSLRIWEHLERYGHFGQSRLSYTVNQWDLSMLQKTLKATAAKLSHQRNGLTSTKCAENLSIKMKRSVGLASTDLSSPDVSPNPLPSLQSSSGEDSITKHARKDRKKKGKAGRNKTGSPTKKVGNQNPQTMKAEVVEMGAADCHLPSPPRDSKEALASQIQQLSQQSSLAEPQALQGDGDTRTVPLNTAHNLSAQTLSDSSLQYLPVVNSAMNFSNSSPFLHTNQLGAGSQTACPTAFFEPYPTVFLQPAMPNTVQWQSYHSSPHSSAASQLHRRPHVYYDFDVKEGQADLVTHQNCEVLPEKQNSQVNSVAMIRTDNTDTSHTLAHWDVGAGRELSTDCSKLDINAEETDGESDPLDDYEKEDYHKKLKQLPRQWEWTPFSSIHQSQQHKARRSKRHQPVEFSIMTYNILSQDLAENHPHLYNGGSSRSLEWQHRRRLLIAEIACHDPDILNLQEVHREHFFSYLKPRLNKLGYVGGYVKRTGDKNDGCATMWKKDKFRLLRSTPVNYCRGGLLDRDNIAIVVELQPIRSGFSTKDSQELTEDKIVVANTHLLFNPRRGDIKLAQLMVLMAEIDRHAYLGPSDESLSPSASSSFTDSTVNGRYCPVIMTGDFNMEPHSEMYKFLVRGQMDYEGLLVRQISGQEEGMYGRNYLLDRNFFSPRYGVTDFCQYHTAVMNRLREKLTVSDSSPSTPSRANSEERVSSPKTMSLASKQQNCKQEGADTTKDADKAQSISARMATSSSKTASGIDNKASPASSSLPVPINTGRLWHHLNLVSAYRHRIERLGLKQPEVTTHHNCGKCTVDYIFYTVNSKEVHYHKDEVRLRHIKDGRLKLLARYGLMSSAELDKMGGIPNSLIPSDHLCLIAKFLLK